MGRKKKGSEVDKGLVLRLYDEGIPRDEIASRASCTPTYVSMVVREAGVPPRSKRTLNHEKIEELFDLGRTHASIAETLGCSRSRVSAVLLAAGKRAPFRKIEGAVAVSLYEKGTSLSDIAQHFSCTESAVRYALKREGVEFTQRKWAVTEDFFQRVDTEEKAYWLGFILADGCVTGNYLQVGLARRDEAHLDKLRAALGTTVPLVFTSRVGIPSFPNHVNTEKVYYGAHLTVGCQRLVLDLHKLNIVPRKSMKEVAPLDQIPDDLHRHFWRGVVDGDGSISSPGRTSGGVTVGLVGSETLCKQFRAFVHSHVTPSGATVRPKGRIFSVNFSRSAVVYPLLGLLYDDASVYLERKRDLAVTHGFTPKYKAIERSDAKLNFCRAEEIRGAFKGGMSRAALAEEYGVSYPTVVDVLRKRTHVAPLGQRYGDSAHTARSRPRGDGTDAS